MSDAMTPEDIVAQIALKTRMDGSDVRDALQAAHAVAAAPGDQSALDNLSLLLQTYADIHGYEAAKSRFQTFLDVMGTIGTVAGVVLPIANAFGAVFGAVAAAKSI